MKYDLAITTFSLASADSKLNFGGPDSPSGNGKLGMDRYECTRDSLMTLFHSDLSFVNMIVISDDGSTDGRLLDFLHFLQKHYSNKVKVIFNPTRTEITHGCSPNAYRAIMGCESEHIIRLSDDAVFHPVWLQKLSELQTTIEEEIKEDWGALSCTNWGLFPNYPDGEIIQKEVVKRSVIPSFAAVYKRSIWEDRFPSIEALLSEMHGNLWRKLPMGAYSYEWAYRDECFKRGLYSFTTETSWCKHLFLDGKQHLGLEECQVLNYANPANPVDAHKQMQREPISKGLPITEKHKILLDHGQPINDPPPPFLNHFVASHVDAANRVASKFYFRPPEVNKEFIFNETS